MLVRLLKNNFKENDDFKVINFAPPIGGANDQKMEEEGHNKETIMLNIKTFKKLCLKSRTDKADEIHDYYIKLEEIIQETLKEQSEEQEKKLLAKEKEIDNIQIQLQQKDELIDNMVTYPEQPKYLYIAHNPAIPSLSKLGITKNILERKDTHNTSNPDLIYQKTYTTQHARELETFLKQILKPFKYSKPEWFECTIQHLQDIVDYFFDLFETYEGHITINGLHRFVSIAQQTRIKYYEKKYDTEFSDDIYKQYVDQRLEKESKFKINVSMLLNDFEKWLDDKPFKKNLRNVNNKIPSSIKDCIINKLANIVDIPKSKGISYTNPAYNVHFSKCNGFIGLKLKSLKPKELISDEVYTQYIKSVLHISNESRDKITRLDMVKTFINWANENNITLNKNIYSSTNNYTQQFLNEFVSNMKQHDIEYSVCTRVLQQTKIAAFSKIKFKVSNGYSCIKPIK